MSLPLCREVASKGSAGEVLSAMVAADAEISGALGHLADQGAADRESRRGGSRKLSGSSKTTR